MLTCGICQIKDKDVYEFEQLLKLARNDCALLHLALSEGKHAHPQCIIDLTKKIQRLKKGRQL